MRSFKEKEMKENGVTLIALVVIIIILLILAGITIATLTGDNSIVKNANRAEDAAKITQIEELVREEAVHTYDKRGEFDSEQFKDNVRNHLGQYDPEIREDEDTITVTIDGVDVVIDKETGDIYDSTNMRPIIKVEIYQPNGQPIDPNKYYENVIITVSISNKDKFENLEITLEDAAGNEIEKDDEVTGEGEASFTVKGEGVYTVIAIGTIQGEEKKSTKKVTLEYPPIANVEVNNEIMYNGKEQSGVTGSNVTWSGEKIAVDAGTYIITATPTKGSIWSDGTDEAKDFTWKINPKSVAVTWGSTISFVYNGKEQGPTASVTSGVSGETINVIRTTGVNVGSYTSTASIANVSGGRGKASNYTLTNTTKAFTITNATITGSVKITGTNKFGSTLTAEASVNPGDATISYQWYSNTSNSTSGGTPISGATGKTYQVGSGLVGKYIYVEVTAQKPNYANATFVDITDSTNNGSPIVTKKSIEKPTTTEGISYTYNGTNQTINLNGFDGETMNISGNTEIDAGSYTATVSLKDSNNYQWTDGSTGNVTLIWEINAKSVEVTWGSTTSFVYNGKEQGPTASATSGVSGETINVIRTTGVNVGSYTSTASIASVTGGREKASNYTLTNTTKAFTITNATITGSVKITGTNKFGSTLTAEVGVNPGDATLSYQWYSNTSNSTSGGTPINGATGKTYQVGSGLVGKYIYVVVTAKKANYTNATFSDITDSTNNGSATVTKINVAKPTVSGSYTYNGASQTLSLSGYNSGTMNVSGNTGTDAGNYTATVSLKDSSNYQWSDGSTGNVSLSWKINAKSVAVTWGETTSFVYNGKEQAPTATASSGVSGETINLTRTTGTNVGSYTSIASIESVTGGREKASNYTLTNTTKAFTITNATITGSVKITGTNKFGSTLTAEVSVNPGDATISYQWYSNTSNSTSGGTAINGATGKTYQVGSGLVGKYIYVVVTAKKTNYANVTFSDITDSTNNGSVTVTKISLNKPTATGSYTYNGASQTLSLSGYNSSTMNVSGNTGTDAGNYTATISLKDSSNYQWSDGSTGNVSLSWKINAKSVAVTWGETTSFAYNGKAQAPTATASSGVSGETLNITRTTAVDVGTHTSTASIASVTGGRGKASNYTLTNTTKAFTITNATITGSVKITGTNKFGSTLTAETSINPGDATISYQWYSNTSNSTSGGTAINGATGKTYQVGSGLVGKYIYVVVTAKKTNYANATFKDITDSTNNGSVTVTKISLNKPTATGSYTYNGASQTLSLSGYNSSTMNVSGNIGTDAGNYTATISLKDSSNYQWSDGSTGNVSLSWKINAKSVAVTWGETTSFAYNGKAQAPTATASSGVSGETINLTRTTGTNVGSYTSIASITSVSGGRANKNNYALTGNTKQFTITRAKTATASAANKTYNGATQTGVTGSQVTWSGTQSAIDAGTYTAKATPTSNYAWSDGTTGAKTITWTMNKKSVAVTWGSTTFTYNGKAQGPTASATSGVSGETINVTRTTATNAGTHTSTASISSVSGGRGKASNYTLTGNTKAFTINKKAIQKTSGDYRGNYDGNSHTINLVVNEPTSGCTIYYSTSTELTSSNYSSSGSTSKPSRISAGTTTVYWYIHTTNANYSDISGSNTITIKSVAPTISFGSNGGGFYQSAGTYYCSECRESSSSPHYHCPDGHSGYTTYSSTCMAMLPNLWTCQGVKGYARIESPGGSLCNVCGQPANGKYILQCNNCFRSWGFWYGCNNHGYTYIPGYGEGPCGVQYTDPIPCGKTRVNKSTYSSGSASFRSTISISPNGSNITNRRYGWSTSSSSAPSSWTTFSSNSTTAYKTSYGTSYYLWVEVTYDNGSTVREVSNKFYTY